MIEQREVLAKNLIKYRKYAGLTQQDLAEKLNYSDKTVSKWERAEGTPDIFVLKQIADIYGIKVDLLLSESPEKKPKTKRIKNIKRIIIMTLATLLVWLVATTVYVLLTWIVPPNKPTYYVFICALPVTAIIVIVFSSIWKKSILQFLSITTLIWTLILCLYLLFIKSWYIFLIGIPLQALEIFWHIFRNVK